MGFFSNIKNRARQQVAPVMPMAPQPMPRPSVMPRMGNMGFRGRMPQKRGGLGGLFRKLQEQIRNQLMQPAVMPNTPNLPNYFRGIPINAALERKIAEMGAVRKEVPMQTPTMGMTAPAPENMRNLQIPTEMPVMPDERMAPPVMNQMQGQPRMMMAGGRDANMVNFLNSDPRQQMFGIETRIGMLENQLQEALANNDKQSFDMIVQEINNADAQIIDIKNSINPLRTSGRPEMVGPRFDGFEEFITSIGPQNYGDYVGEPTLDDILADLEKKN